MFDIGLGEIIALAAIALLVFGPDQLPKVAAQAGRFLRDIRTMAASARQELSDSAGMEEIGKDLKSLTDLHPKRLMASVWEDPTQDAAKPPDPSGGKPRAAAESTSAAEAGAAGEGNAPKKSPTSPSFDPDAT